VSINATIAGRIGKDAETRSAGSSTVTGFSLATDVGYGERKHTVWIDCSIWGKRGESVARFLRKGAYVVVSGTMDMHEYNGKVYPKLEVLNLDLGPKQSNGGDYQRPTQATAQQTGKPYAAPGAPADEDIPF